MKQPPKILIDLTGQTFGRWFVVKKTRTITEPAGGQRVCWLCKCVCGKEKEVIGHSLRKGVSTSCGCIKLRADAPLNYILSQYKRRAKAAELEFSLSKSDVASLIDKSCHYCGCPPKQGIQSQVSLQAKSYFKYTGIDRVNNEEGYHASNCVPCCGFCNRRKGSTFTEKEFLDWVTRVYKHKILGEADVRKHDYRDYLYRAA